MVNCRLCRTHISHVPEVVDFYGVSLWIMRTDLFYFSSFPFLFCLLRRWHFICKSSCVYRKQSVLILQVRLAYAPGFRLIFIFFLSVCHYGYFMTFVVYFPCYPWSFVLLLFKHCFPWFPFGHVITWKSLSSLKLKRNMKIITCTYFAFCKL